MPVLPAHEQVASSLEAQSGVPCHSPAAAALQRSVLAGDWDAADLWLGRLAVGCPETTARARFLLLEHKFLEVGGWVALQRPGCVEGKEGRVPSVGASCSGGLRG